MRDEMLSEVGHLVPDPQGRPMHDGVKKYMAGIKRVPYVHPQTGEEDPIMTTPKFYCNGVVFEGHEDFIGDLLQMQRRIEDVQADLHRMVAHFAQRLWFEQRKAERDALAAEAPAEGSGVLRREAWAEVNAQEGGDDS